MLQTRNALLQRAEKAVRSRISAQNREAVGKTVVAGLSIMYSPGGAKLMKEQFAQDGDVPKVVSEGAAKLVGLLIHQSRRTMPPAVAAIAVTLFALEGLDVMSKTQGVKITNDLIASTIQEAGSAYLQLYGVTSEKLRQMAEQRQAASPAMPGGIVGAAAQPVAEGTV